MNLYIDTSSLVKLYHKERETEDLMRKMEKMTIKKIYLSELAKVEFASAIWRKIRVKDIKT